MAEDDIINLKPLADRLDDYRDPVLKIRIHNKDKVTNILENAKNSENGISLYLVNSAKDGLKDSNQGISFENLKNPTRLIETLKSISIAAPEANKNIDILSDIAIKERSPELAACLLEATSKGITGFGVDSKTAQKILVDSKEMIKKNGGTDADYYSYLSNIDQAYQKMFKGKTLDNYIKENYKPTWQKAATGVLVGGGLALAPFTAGISLLATAGGAALYSTNWFGQNEEGQNLLNTLDKARSKDHKFNEEKYTDIMTMGFGGLTAQP
jgi:hypothetical protein